MRLRSKTDNTLLQNISHDLSNNDNIVHKNWIREKIEEIENKGI